MTPQPPPTTEEMMDWCDEWQNVVDNARDSKMFSRVKRLAKQHDRLTRKLKRQEAAIKARLEQQK